MTIEPTEFDLVALARRGLLAIYDEAVAELGFAQRHAKIDVATMEETAETKEAKAKAYETWSAAYDRVARFDMLYPQRAAA